MEVLLNVDQTVKQLDFHPLLEPLWLHLDYYLSKNLLVLCHIYEINHVTNYSSARQLIPEGLFLDGSAFFDHVCNKINFSTPRSHESCPTFPQEGFYVQKRLDASFRSLQQLASEKREPVYCAVFQQHTWDSADGLDIRSPYQPSESRLTMTPSSRLHFPALPDDSNLRNYLLRLRIWFGDPSKSLHYFEIEDAHYEVRYRDKCEEVSTSLKQRAQLLGEFVAEQMSGLTQERNCDVTSVHLHIADIMNELKSCIIGLGFVKCGGGLERALLYKVLSDRVGLPCALHRHSGAHAWCEVAVPEVNPNEELKDETYPAGLLRVNYVVDLVEQPGRLLPLSSPEARRVCDRQCSPYTARALPAVCKCEREPTRD